MGYRKTCILTSKRSKRLWRKFQKDNSVEVIVLFSMFAWQNIRTFFGSKTWISLFFEAAKLTHTAALRKRFEIRLVSYMWFLKCFMAYNFLNRINSGVYMFFHAMSKFHVELNTLFCVSYIWNVNISIYFLWELLDKCIFHIMIWQVYPSAFRKTDAILQASDVPVFVGFELNRYKYIRSKMKLISNAYERHIHKIKQ